MGTVFRNPNWLMPNNSNRDKVANYSLDFDSASSSYIDSNLNISSYNEFSVSLWLKRNNSTAYIVGQWVDGTSSNQSYVIQLYNNNVYFNIRNASLIVNSAISTTTLNNSDWYHIAATWDGSNIKIYINGTLEDTTSCTTMNNPSSTIVTRIGAASGGSLTPFDGQLCQISIFNYTLQEEDITTLYGNSTSGVGDPLSLTTKPIAYYPLGDELFWNNSQFIAPNSVINTGDKLGGICVASVGDGRITGLNVSPGGTASGFDDIPLQDGVGGSCSFWFKWTQGSTPGWTYLINNGSGSGSPFNWRILNSDGKLYYHGTGSTWVGVSFNANQWYNVTITCSPFDNTSQTTTVKFYIDATLVDTRTAAFGAAAVSRLGGLYNVQSNQWARFVNFATFTKELIQSEVNDLYNNGEPAFLLTHDNINAYYPLTRDFVNILNGALVTTNAISNKFNIQPGNWSASSIVADYPTQQASGLAYNIAQESLIGNAPYSTNNIASNNGQRSQLLPIAAGRVNVSDPTKYTITVDTRITDSGSTNTSTFQLPLNQGTNNNATVNWGDGTTSTGLTANTEHVYPSPGVYQITIEAPNYIQSAYKSGGYGIKDQMKIISVDAFGSNQIHHTGSNGWFSGCYNFDIKALDAPNWYTNLAYSFPRPFYMFASTQSLVNENRSLSLWAFPNTVGSPQNIFRSSWFNNNAISNWSFPNSTNAISFSGAFSKNHFFNQPVNWTAPVISSLNQMFSEATQFNQDISNLDFSNSSNNSSFLYLASSFNNGGQPMDNITFSANCSNMTFFMRACSKFNQDVSNWTMPTTTCNYSQMFYGCGSFQGTGMNTWSTSGPISGLNLAFGNCGNFNGDVSWLGNLASNCNVSRAFEKAYLFTGTGIKTNWNIQDANGNLYNMFYRAGRDGGGLNVDLSSWDVSNVTSLYGFMYETGTNGSPGDISSWDVSSVTSFQSAFLRCYGFNANLNNWDFSSATTLRQMLYQVSAYNQPALWQLGNNTTDLNQTFYSCGTSTGGGATQDRWTDTVVNFAVKAYNNSGQPAGVTFSGQNNQPAIDTTQTQTENSVNYSTFYGSQWPSGWTNAGDAVAYLSETINWSGL